MHEGLHDIAQICLNGHVVNALFNSLPQFNENYCGICGKETITSCLNCNASIKGHYIGPITTHYEAPNYCSECGNPYPWIERGIKSIGELIELTEANREDKDTIMEGINDIMISTPSTQATATRMRTFLDGASKHVATAIREIIVEIASDAAKKIILGK